MSVPEIVQIGCGKMGGYHANKWLELEADGYVSFPAISDTNPGLRSKVEKEYEKAFFDNPMEMIREYRPDAVDIVVPAGNHAETMHSVIDAGIKNILVEKPLVPLRKLEDGKGVLQYAHEHNVRTMTADIVIYEPVMKALHEHEGEFGKKEKIIEQRRSGYAWRMSDVSVIDDLAIHGHMGCKKIIGYEPLKVIHSVWSNFVLDEIDYCEYFARSPSGITFLSISEWIPNFGIERKYQTRVTYIRGSKSFGRVDHDSGTLMLVPSDVMERVRTANVEDRAVLEKTGIQSFNVSVPKGDALRIELEHFASVVRYGGEFLTPAEREFEALQEMQTILFGNSAKS